MTDNKIEVKYDSRTFTVTPSDVSELVSNFDTYDTYCGFWNWTNTFFDFTADTYFTNLHEKFHKPLKTAYDNYCQYGLDFDGLPTHTQYLELVWAFNRGLATGMITLKQQVQEVVSQPVQPPDTSSSTSHQGGIFDGIPYVDQKAARIKREEDEKRAQVERERVHDACMKTVMGWVAELVGAFKRTGREPMSPSKLFPSMRLPMRAAAWSNGWIVKDAIYITTSGDFYELRRQARYDGTMSRHSLSTRQVVEIMFKTDHFPFIQTADGTIKATPNYYSEYPSTLYDCDVKQYLIDLVRGM